MAKFGCCTGGESDGGRFGRTSGHSGPGEDCQQFIVAHVDVHYKLSDKTGSVESWTIEEGIAGALSNMLNAPPGAQGQIIKVCMCLGFWKMTALLTSLAMAGGGNDWKLRKGQSKDQYTLVTGNTNCYDHKGIIFVTKKCGPGSKCLCKDYKGIKIKGINEKTVMYTASDGTKIGIGPTLLYREAVKKIIDAEKKIQLNCADNDPDGIIIDLEGEDKKDIF